MNDKNEIYSRMQRVCRFDISTNFMTLAVMNQSDEISIGLLLPRYEYRERSSALKQCARLIVSPTVHDSV